jgi:predicted MFS family arabinose efflux permease
MHLTRPRLFFTLAVLLAINTMNFFDRQVPGAVAEPMKQELQLSDEQLGWLTPAFIVLYAIVGVPLGRWADLGRRTRILAAGVTVWSLFTMLSGWAWSFGSLFAARMGVGIGEASCAPAANSLLGDLVPRERRARAISVFMLGLPLGLGLSFIISGNVAHYWGWRSAYFLAGVPGLLLGLLSLWIPEPVRGGAEARHVGAARRPGSPILLVLTIPTMWWIILSGALHNFNMYALGQFLSPYLQRCHGLNTSQAGWISGVVYGCFGGLGILLGGYACDWIVRRRVSGRLEVSAAALAIAVPCMFIGLRQPPGSYWAFGAWMLPGCMLLYVYYAGVYAAIQDIVEPALRGTAMAVYFFIMYLVAAFGPVLTGRLSDFLARRAMAEGVDEKLARAVGLHDAMYVIPAIGVALVVVLFIASRTVKADYLKLHKWMESGALAAAENDA